jgi:hypothetical protein
MGILHRLVVATACPGTHHRLAMDALLLLRCPDADGWRDLFLNYYEPYLRGAKEPDTKFRDFQNHVLHVRENGWGGAIRTAQLWYERLVIALRRQYWSEAVHTAGILGHYIADPMMPLHTAQSEEEGRVHRALEWSVAKSYDELRNILVTDQGGFPSLPLHDTPDWLARLLRQGAELANAHYETLLDHYHLERGIADPPLGLDQECKDRLAQMIGFAAAAIARVLEKAFVEAGSCPPMCELVVETVLATVKAPMRWVAQRYDEEEEQDLLEEILEEVRRIGKALESLPDDEKLVRKLHAQQVLRIPLRELDALPAKPTGSRHGQGAVERDRETGWLARVLQWEIPVLGWLFADDRPAMAPVGMNALATRIGSPRNAAGTGRSVGTGRSAGTGRFATARRPPPVAEGTSGRGSSGQGASGRGASGQGASLGTPFGRRPGRYSGSRPGRLSRFGFGPSRRGSASPPAGESSVESSHDAELEPTIQGDGHDDRRPSDREFDRASDRASDRNAQHSPQHAAERELDRDPVRSARRVDREAGENTERTGGPDSGRGAGRRGAQAGNAVERPAESGDHSSEQSRPDNAESPENTGETRAKGRYAIRERMSRAFQGVATRVWQGATQTASKVKSVVPKLRRRPATAEEPTTQATTNEQPTNKEPASKEPAGKEPAGSRAANRSSSAVVATSAAAAGVAGAAGGRASANTSTGNASTANAGSVLGRETSSAGGSAARDAGASAADKRAARASELRFHLEPDSEIVDAPSIGQKLARRLEALNVKTVGELLRADPAKLAARMGGKQFTAETVERWQQQAELMCRVPELRGHDAQILVASGVTDPKELAGVDPATLFEMIEPFLSTREAEEMLRGTSPPDLNEVADWIDWAQHARPLPK